MCQLFLPGFRNSALIDAPQKGEIELHGMMIHGGKDCFGILDHVLRGVVETGDVHFKVPTKKVDRADSRSVEAELLLGIRLLLLLLIWYGGRAFRCIPAAGCVAMVVVAGGGVEKFMKRQLDSFEHVVSSPSVVLVGLAFTITGTATLRHGYF